MPTLGIEAGLSFAADAAISGIIRAGQAFGQMHSGAKGAMAGVKQLGSAFSNLGVAALPVAAGVTLGAESAIKFQHAMAQTAATAPLTAKEYDQLRLQAIQMGIDTQFSATQVTEAQKLMRQAGASVSDILVGLPGVLAAAGAGEISLAQATDTVRFATKEMGLGWAGTTRIANVFAVAAEKIGTTIPALGEAFSYVGDTARRAGFGLEETTVAVALLQASGQRGTKAGTEIVHMLTKLVHPSKEAAKQIKAWGLSLVDSQGKMKPLAEIVGMLTNKIENVKSASERMRIATVLTGIQGARAYGVLSREGTKGMEELTESLKHSEGAAAAMAKKRLDSVEGQMHLLKSSIETMSTEFFGPMLPALQSFVTFFTGKMNNVMHVMEGMTSKNRESLAYLKAQYGDTAVAIATGLLQAIDDVKNAFKYVQTEMTKAHAALRAWLTDDDIAKVARYAALTALVLTAVVPIAAVLGGIGFIVSSVVVPAFSGLLAIVTGIFGVVGSIVGLLGGPLTLALAAAGAAIYANKRDNETWMESIQRGMDGMDAKQRAKVREETRLMYSEWGKMFEDTFGPIEDAIRDYRTFLGITEHYGAAQIAPVPASANTDNASALTLPNQLLLTDAEVKASQVPNFNPNIDVQVPPHAPCPDVHAHLSLDGTEIAHAVAKRQQEFKDRAGARSDPYQRRVAAEQSVVNPQRGGGG